MAFTSKKKNLEESCANIFPIVAVLLLLSTFDEARVFRLSTVALLSILVMPLIIWYVYIRNIYKISQTDKYIIAVFAIFIVIQCLNIIWSSIYNSITPIYRSFTALMFVLYIRNMRWGKKEFGIIRVCTLIAVILGFATIYFPGSDGENPVFGNYNTVGALYFTLGTVNFVIYMHNKNKCSQLLCAFCILLMLISNTRSALFLSLILLFGFIILNCFSRRFVRPKYIYPICILVIIGFVWFYYNIKSLDIYNTINAISRQLFNKNFDSGRPDLWHYTMEAVGENWLFGCGTGIDLESFFPRFKTPHSVYFDIYLQNGIIGLISYIGCIFSVVFNKGKWEKNKINVLLIVIIFVVLFYNAVGIIFTKARSGIGIIQWGLMALPYRQANKDANLSGVKSK